MNHTNKKLSMWDSLSGIVNNTIGLVEQRTASAFEKASKKKPGLTEVQRVSVVDNTELAQQEARYVDRFSYLTYDTMNLMANRDVVVGSIIARRCAQVAKFSRPAHKKYAVGYSFEVLPGLEPDEKDPETIAFLEDYILNTGLKEERPKDESMNFEEFLRRETCDLLKYDQVAIEKIPAYDGSLHSFLPIDSGTIRYSRNTQDYPPNIDEARMPDLDRWREDKRMAALEQNLEGIGPHDIKFVQLINNRITAYYTYDDIIFKTFNPVNDIRLNGYSIGPLEKLIAIVTSHLHAEAHNKFYFTQGFSTRGILSIKGNVPQPQLEAFRRQWYNQISGAENSWRTPIIGGENVDVEWVPLSMNNRDMEWDIWMHYLVKVICALYLMAPQEIGWDSNTGIISAAGDSGKRNMVLLTESKDVGLEPILRFFENVINEEVLPSIDPKLPLRYKFRFTGYGTDNPTEETERQIRQLTNFKTLDEVRIEMGLPPVGDPFGGMILNPTLAPFYQAMMFPEEPAKGDSSSKAKNAHKKKDREAKSAKKKDRQSKK